MGFITYKQADSRWGKKNYNGSSTMATAGCGPTACAMIAYGIDGKTTPLDTMKYMQSHGYAIRNNGTAWNGIPACLKAYGLQNVQDVPNMTKCWELMSQGYVGVFLFRKGLRGGITWTTSGHYITVTDYKVQNGKHYIYTRDSGGRNHTGWYCYETQMQGLLPKIWLGSMPKAAPKPISTPAQSTSGKIYTGAFPTKTIKKGSKGTQVTRWQNFLKWMGYDLKADGKFGPITVEKTKAAQKKFGFTGKDVDGIVGPKTIKKAKAFQKQVASPSSVTPTPAPTSTPTPAPTPAPTPVTSDLPKKCIDVSYWQGKISQANWEKIRKSCGYAICRTSYTSQSKFSLGADSTFATNFTNAKAAGLKVGAYHYSQAITVAEAKAEAEFMCNILKNYTPTFYVVCDFEYGGRLSSKIGKKASDIANAFCDVVKAHGYSPCIYANTSTLNSNLTNPKYPVWVAQYNDTCTYKGSKVMWQYTSKGRVDGISAANTNSKSANVDLSHVYAEPSTNIVVPEPPISNPQSQLEAEPAPIISIAKPSTKYNDVIPYPTLKKGSKGFNVSNLQKFLNWYSSTFNLKVDGDFGALTDAAVKVFQKTEGLTDDGIYGSKSQAKANTYGTNVSKLLSKMAELAWEPGSAKSKYAYDTGAPKEACKTAMKKYGYKTKAQWSDCGDFVNTVVRESTVDTSFTSLHAVKTPFPTKEDKFDIVWSGKPIPDGFLEAGDSIRYKKTNDSQHAMFYFGDGKVCDAGHYNRFGNIRADEKRYAYSNVKTSTIQVLRVKE